jgi:hypothetical protein
LKEAAIISNFRHTPGNLVGHKNFVINASTLPIRPELMITEIDF